MFPELSRTFQAKFTPNHESFLNLKTRTTFFFLCQHAKNSNISCSTLFFATKAKKLPSHGFIDFSQYFNYLCSSHVRNNQKKHLSSRNFISYHRYANDCILIIRKNATRGYINEINSYDKGLKFILDEMSPKNEIIFLDTKIFKENGIQEFIKHRKKETPNDYVKLQTQQYVYEKS